PTNPNVDTRDMTSSPQPSPPKEERETAPAAQWFVGATRESPLRGVLSCALSSRLAALSRRRSGGGEGDSPTTYDTVCPRDSPRRGAHRQGEGHISISVRSTELVAAGRGNDDVLTPFDGIAGRWRVAHPGK